MLRYSLLLLVLVPVCARAQVATPKLAELPAQTQSWPPAWAALARDLAAAPDDFEKIALERAGKLMLAEPGKDSCRYAETILAATLRHHLSVRRGPPLAKNPWQATQDELQDRLANVRKDWLAQLGDDPDALKLADAWLPVTPSESPLRAAILDLWIRHASADIDKNNYSAASISLRRMEAHFTAVQCEPIRKPLRQRADGLFKDAQGEPDVQAIKSLEEALELWPGLPDARDLLERRKGTYRMLVVGVRSLPQAMSPATAWTEVEKQSLALLFDRLYACVDQAPLGRRYRPQLAASLPDEADLSSTIALRSDVYWSSGARVTNADIRHTALLMNKEDATGRSALWRDFLEIPRFDGDPLRYRQGLLDPLAPLTFWVLPQYYGGKQLQRADDADFARAPVGSGPFQFVARKQDGDKMIAHFQANPHDLRPRVSHVREIRMIAWSDARKDLAKPLPHLLLDAPTDQLAALKDLGYTEMRTIAAAPVHFLAVNQRKPTLASPAMRRTIAHALDRQSLLNRHFRAGTAEKYHTSANGLFPRGSWAACPAPRVPAELFDLEQARSFARQVKVDADAQLTLKYPVGDPRVKAACADMAEAISAVLRDGSMKVAVQAIGLPPQELRKALVERAYDLLYVAEEGLDDPVRLALLLDPSADALKAGGSNYLGCEDVKLQELLHAAVKHRQFSAAQAGMHAVHVHFHETMPAIPLWQLEVHVLAQPGVRMPALDSRYVFARIRQWQLP